MSTVRDLVAEARKALEAAGVDAPMREAQLLVAAATGVARDRMAISLGEAADAGASARLAGMLAARAQHQPLSHILGHRDFFNHRFKVSAEVLDPRPETEALVAAALERNFARVLDLGTGSGAIILSLLAERPEAVGVASDLSADALAVARDNAEALGVAGRCDFVLSDWFAAIEARFDLIVSNPPYIAVGEMPGLAPELAFEPRMALTDEGDGLSAYRAIAAGARAHLEPGGRLMVEIGPTQGAAVAAIFAAAGLENISIRRDLDGRDRVVMGENPRS